MKYAASLTSLAVLIATGSASRADDNPAQSRATSSALPGVTVYGQRLESDNYRTEAVDTIGPMGSASLLDTPYSVAVLPPDLIKNSMAVNFKDVSKYLPLVAYQEQQGPDILRPQTRGMQGGNFQNSRIDGMTMFVTVANALEQFQQIEVVNGVSAFLYGPANPSGMFNFVTKRPTEETRREFELTYNSNSIGTAKVDWSQAIDAGGIFKVRFNGVFGEGGGYVDGSHQKRELGDLGVDIRPFKDTVLELNFSAYRLTNKGFPGWFSYGQAINLPSTPNPKWVGYDQEFLGVDLKTQISEIRIKHDFGPNWHLVVGALNQDGTRNITTQVNNLSGTAGDYTSSMGATFAPRFVITSDSAYLNGTFETGPLAHDLTIGTAGYRASSYALINTPTAANLLLGTANINSPAIYPYPVAGFPNSNANYDSSDVYQQGVNLGDTVRVTDQWSARIGLSQDWFHTNNFSKAGVLTTQYADHGLSPTGSIMFKPASNMTVYATYASSLQAGDLAPTGTANAGEGLSPYRSKEYELGFKARLATIDLAAAVFRIDRPFANIFVPTNTFQITGNQVNKGIELSATGQIVEGLTIYSGITLLDARLENTPLATTNDQRYVGSSKIKGNTLFEYRIPGIAGLTAIFNYQYTGPRAGNDTNSLTVAGYNLFDVGGRYASSVFGLPLTIRLSVDNITDRRYWSTVAPSNLTGANTGSLLAHFGTPRTVLAAVSMSF